MKFRLFKRNKNKKEEKGHREPIIVRIYKDSGSETPLVSINDSDENTLQPGIPSGSDGTAARSCDTQASQTGKTPAESNDTAGSTSKRLFERNPKYASIAGYSLITIVIAIVLAMLIFNVSSVINVIKDILSVLSPFIGAGLLAFIMAPIVNFFDDVLFAKLFKIKKPAVRKALAVILMYLIFFAIIVSALIILLPQVWSSLKELLNKGGNFDISNAITSIKSWLEGLMPNTDFSGFETWANGLISDLTTKISSFVSESIPSVLSASYSAVKGVINILLAIAISIYMVCDKRRIASAATALTYSILPVKKAANFISTSRECGQIFFGFIIGKTIDSMIIGIITFLVLTIGGLPYPLLVSVVVGITNMIPFFGPFIGAIPGVLLYLCIDPIYAFAFALIILAIQQFDGWFLGPLILGDSTGINPLWVIFGITVGGAYFGLPGMFLGVPVTAVIVYLVHRLVSRRLKKKKVEVS